MCSTPVRPSQGKPNVKSWTTGKVCKSLLIISAFVLLQMGGPGKKDVFKSPKIAPVLISNISDNAMKKAEAKRIKEDNKAVTTKKNVMKKTEAEKRAADKKAKLIQKAAQKKADIQQKTASKNASKEKNAVPESPATVVRRIATEASKIKYAATLASERPEIEANSTSSNPQVPTTSVPKKHPLMGVVNEGNCMYVLII